MPNRASLPPMNLTAKGPMTLAAFLAWEERQELRYEFDGVEPVAMAGGSLATPPSNAILRWRSEAACGESLASSSAATSRSKRRKIAVATRTEW